MDPILRRLGLMLWISGAAAFLTSCGEGTGILCGGTCGTNGPLPIGMNTHLRAVHMGGNWGTNVEGVHTLPPDYFEYLHDLNVNWVGISVALHVQDSMDSAVERTYSGVEIPTFDDETLAQTIRVFRQQGFNVYLTLAFEDQNSKQAARPVQRWQLGDPNMPLEDTRLLATFWPWSLSHPDHARFVDTFWDTYTQQAVHFGKIAEVEGIRLYSLGTETERLFRSRSGGYWPNDFGGHLRSMVRAVRAVYSGLLTYDMAYHALTANEFYGPGSDHLWEDLDLDVVGISAYFPLTDAPPNAVSSVEDLELRWEQVFQDYLIPLQARNPNRPILFLEFGYVDAVAAPYQANADEFTHRVFVDANENRLDDGEETQAHIYQAFLNTMDRHPGVLRGAFLWGEMMASNEEWARTFALLRGFSVRQKLAEEVVRMRYAKWR